MHAAPRFSPLPYLVDAGVLMVPFNEPDVKPVGRLVLSSRRSNVRVPVAP